MSKIISIGTAVPAYKHDQLKILDFMQRVYAMNDSEKRKLSFIYRQGGIDSRYSVIPDYSLPAEQWEFYSPTENLEPFPRIEQRMKWYQEFAGPLSKTAAENCLSQRPGINITHLITVSCTGMSAPGLDLELMELLNLPPATTRTSVNFMGCYAALHALKIANAFCIADHSANVLIVCTELCTLHFQRENTVDNITSSMLFSDGSAAVLVTGDEASDGFAIENFYSSVLPGGKQEMAWELSSKGFLMTLSSYIPGMINENFHELVTSALSAAGKKREEITHWCIHPGGKKILEAVHNSLSFTNGQLEASSEILRQYGNMSSASVLFVLQKMMSEGKVQKGEQIFTAAFGPGLTMETLILSA